MLADCPRHSAASGEQALGHHGAPRRRSPYGFQSPRWGWGKSCLACSEATLDGRRLLSQREAGRGHTRDLLVTQGALGWRAQQGAGLSSGLGTSPRGEVSLTREGRWDRLKLVCRCALGLRGQPRWRPRVAGHRAGHRAGRRAGLRAGCGAARGPRSTRAQTGAGSLRAPGRAGGGQGGGSPAGPGRGFWPASWTPQPTALGGAHASAPRRPRACWRRRRTPRTRALAARPLANEQFLLRMHKAVPASAFSRGVAWEPGAAGFASALRLRPALLLGDAPGRNGLARLSRSGRSPLAALAGLPPHPSLQIRHL